MKTTKLWSVTFLALIILVFAACSKDDPKIATVKGLRLADGIYMKKSDGDPLAANILVAEKVEDGFKTKDREGFVGNYMFLIAGNYQMVEVKDKKITSTMGGAATTVEASDSECDLKTVTVVDMKIDGAALSIPADGIYKVTYDKTFSELVVYKIEKAVLIGSASPAGWSHNDNQVLTATATPTADQGVTYKIENLVLRQGEFKVRFNCGWKINRSDKVEGRTNGYNSLINFGGTLDNLVHGGDNFKIAAGNDGKYTVELKWTPKDGFKGTLTKTGDAPVITFDPNDYKWGIIGDATIKGWTEDRNMHYKKEGENHVWYSVITFKASGEFKFRTNDDWKTALGGTLTTSTSGLSTGGGNIATPGAGDYYIVLSTADEGKTWTATMSEAGWEIIGEGSPQGNWNADIDMTAAHGSGGKTTYTLTGNFTDKDWKFRAGDDWKYSLGGTLASLEVGGGNLKMPSGGNYTVVLSYDGTQYTVVATKNP